MLIEWKAESGYAERLAVGYIRESSWDQAGPEWKYIKLA
jgi:hypothetical protein